MNKVLRTTLAVLLAAMIMPAFVFAEGSAEEGPQEVNMTYVNWAEGVAWTHLLGAILEDEMGYDVTLTAADVGPAYASVAAGDQDFYMEAWLPNLHETYVEGEDYVEVSTLYENAVLGLIVPQYMADDGVTALSDLADPEVVGKLDGKITGIDAGAGMMIKTQEELIPAYGLDDAGLELIASSSPAMLAALESAIQDEEYIVGMGWQPHTMFGRYDIVILEQDGEQIWANDNVYILGRPGVEEDLPEVVEFLDNAYFTNDTIGPLMVKIDDSNMEPMEAVREWKDNNQDVWSDWVPN